MRSQIPKGQADNVALRWRHNGCDSVSNHQPHDCLLNCSFGRRSKKTSKLRVTGLCVGNSPGTGEFLVQMASNAENVSIRWRHHGHRGSICHTPLSEAMMTHSLRRRHVASPGHNKLYSDYLMGHTSHLKGQLTFTNFRSFLAWFLYSRLLRFDL